MREQICHLRPTYLHWECPEIPFTKTVGNKFVRGVPASLKSFVVTLLSRPDLTLGTAVTEPGYLSAMGVIGS